AWKIPYLLGFTVVAGAAVLILPERLIFRLWGLLGQMDRHPRRAVVGLAIGVSLAGVLYASHQESLTDERHLLRASVIVAEQGIDQFFAGYEDITWLGGQHPPLLPLVYGLAIRLIGFRLLALRLIATAITAGAVLLTYYIGEAWFDRRTAMIAALCLLSMPYCLRMGTAVLTDMPLTLLFGLGLYLVHRLSLGRSLTIAVAAGVSIGLGLVSKYTMLLIYPVLLLHFLAEVRLRRAWAYVGVTVLVSAAILGSWLLYADSQDLVAAQAETVSRYAGAVTGGAWRYFAEMIATELPSALGLYNLPLIVLGAVLLLQQRSKSDLLVALWIAPVMAIVALTLPDPRYFMPAFPGLAIAMARRLTDFDRSVVRIVLLALLLCTGALILFSDWNRATFLFFPMRRTP
ncbi:MAG: glycosyltransferase family 39 protein, partial [Anaerolineae bacterium]